MSKGLINIKCYMLWKILVVFDPSLDDLVHLLIELWAESIELQFEDFNQLCQFSLMKLQLGLDLIFLYFLFLIDLNAIDIL